MEKVASHNQFGETIRKARIKKELTIREAAAKAKISPAYFNSLEHNSEGVVPGDEVIRKLSTALGLDYATLRDLSMYVTPDLQAMRRKLSPSESATIQAFYRITRQYDVPPHKALDMLTRVLEKG